MSIELLISHLRRTTDGTDLTAALGGPNGLNGTNGTAAWRDILLDMPLEEWSFDDRFGANAWRETLRSLDAVCAALPMEQPGRGADETELLSHLGLLLLVLNGLNESSHRRSPAPALPSPPGAAATHDCERTCQRLVRDPAVARAIMRVYFPDRPADLAAADPEAVEVWRSDVEGNQFSFHRHGTTSLILRGKGRKKDGAQRPFALKLILFPFLRISRIEQATLAYKDQAPEISADDQHLTRVWASASGWILMDFVAGTPLQEAWPANGSTVDLERLRRYGTALFDALCQFDRRFNPDRGGPRRVHADLSPSNIIVSGADGAPVMRLIDVGRNYLYARSPLTGHQGPDGVYVAPEVKTTTGDEAIGYADLFSLGHLLILLSGAAPRQDRTVPDELYARVPMIARFIEDLIDENPDNRLMLFPAVRAAGNDRYPALRRQFLAELDAAQAAEAGPAAPTDGRWMRGLAAQLRTRLSWDVLRPLAGVPGRLLRVYRSRRGHGANGAADSGMPAGSLLLWSWLSATAWAITASVIVTWFLRQLNYNGAPWQWGTRTVEVYQKALGPQDETVIPVIDGLRAADYPFPDLQHNWPSLLVGITYALVGAKYYQNLFAAVTPLRAGWHAGRLTVWAALAQFFMRLETVAASLLVLPVILIEPRWWTINTAIGQILVYLCNRSSFTFATTAFDTARRRGLSTVPENNATTGMASFGEWVPSSLFYAGAVTSIGLLIYTGRLHDEWVYAVSVAAINLFLFYIIKCGKGAAEVRVLLTRAAFAAERLRLMGQRPPAHGSTGGNVSPIAPDSRTLPGVSPALSRAAR